MLLIIIVISIQKPQNKANGCLVFSDESIGSLYSTCTTKLKICQGIYFHSSFMVLNAFN